nr:MAG TPA: hypothetical protein [Caudoviricetes sp.]
MRCLARHGQPYKKILLRLQKGSFTGTKESKTKSIERKS